VLVAKANPKNISGDPLSMCGLNVGLQIGSVDAAYGPVIQKACKDAGKPDPVITNFTGESAATLAVQSGKVDMCFFTPIGFPSLQKASTDAFLEFQFKGAPVQVLGIAVPKGDTQLANAVLAALVAIQANGSYHSAFVKWGLTELELSTPGINLRTTNPDAIK
jgi:polar amino acid transport system substrate-binding protein